MHAALAARLPFYYGWVIASVAGISGSFISGMTSWGLGIFVTPMQEEFGWSRTLFFLPLALGALVSAIAGPIFGPMLDNRSGVRIWFAIGVVSFGTSLIAMQNVDGFVYYLIVYGVLGGLGHFGLMSTRAILPKWFIRKRGRVLAVAGGLVSFGPLIFPPSLQLMIGSIGWRDTWMITGVVFLILMVPATALVVRAPEDIGLRPDGDQPEGSGAGKDLASQATEISFTRKQAIRTGQFWLLVATVGAGTVALRGIIPNIHPFLVQQGIPPTLASFSFSVYAVTTIAASFAWGTMADRNGVRGPYLALSLVMGTSLVLLWLVDSPPLMFVAMAYLGVGVNAFFILGGLFVANSFGPTHYGAISGLFQPFNNAATYSGPLVFGVVYDLAGASYGALFISAGALWVVAFAAAYAVRPLAAPVATTERSG
jgi:MFS family permease